MLGDTSPIILRVEKLVTGYGDRQILDKVDIEVKAGEVVALIGHNGAGKSTLLKALFGLIRTWAGSVVYARAPNASTPYMLLRGGIVYVPQGNRVFSHLTVRENLQVCAAVLEDVSKRVAGIENAFRYFPVLRNREKQRAGTLSGGEKQMLSLACAMCLNPHLLFLDEPSLGLSPTAVQTIFNMVKHISREADVSCLIVEQKVRHVLNISDRVYALRCGSVIFTGDAAELADEGKLREVYL